MSIRLFLRQQQRNLKRTLLNILLLTAAIAFFVMSMDLYINSIFNLKQAEDTYHTIAIMELYGSVDERGHLVEVNDDNYKGYKNIAVNGYDFSEIVMASGVTGYDLRKRSGAYIQGNPAVKVNENGTRRLLYTEDIIRFTLAKDETVTIPINGAYDEEMSIVYLNILDNAMKEYYCYDNIDFQYNEIIIGDGSEDVDLSRYREQIQQLNRSTVTDTITLYPGVEYIAGIYGNGYYRVVNEKTGEKAAASRYLRTKDIAYFDENFHVYYYNLGEGIASDTYPYTEELPPFPIMRWEDVQNDSELKAQWTAAWEATVYNSCAYTVCFTDDVTGIPLFHLGGISLAAGRMITEEEYEVGSKVCMVSKNMANAQGWQVGDKLKMRFFQFEAFPNNLAGTFGTFQPVYHKETSGFFADDTFEIVGVYEKYSFPGNSGVSATTMTLATDTIYIPHNSVQNTLPEEELPVHGALLTLWLENGSINDFLADMDALGLTERKEGQYNPTFTFYDQGYSVIQPSLQGMYSTAKLLLILSVLLLVITCVLLSYFFAQNQKHNIGVFRMLGGKKTQVLLAVFICSALIAVIGAIPGTMIGHALSERVGETMLTSDFEENEKTAALRAYVLATEETDTSAFDVHSDFKLSLLAGSTALLFPILSLAFVVIYVGREPRELLPKNKA